MNDTAMTVAYHPTPWNKGKLIGQKPPLKLREIWTLRTRLEMGGKTKELALFNLAIDSKLRGCDLVQLRVNDVTRGGEVLTRASVIQQKTQEPVRFEFTDPTRVAIAAWMAKASLSSGSHLFLSRRPARHPERLVRIPFRTDMSKAAHEPNFIAASTVQSIPRFRITPASGARRTRVTLQAFVKPFYVSHRIP